MKICIMSGYLYSMEGGNEIYVRRISKALAERGHQVSVITTVPNISIKPSFGEKEGYKVHSFSSLTNYKRFEGSRLAGLIKPIWHAGDIWDFYSHEIVRNILRKDIPDIVHLHNYRGLSLSAFNIIKKLNLPLVFSAKDYSLICPRYSLLKGTGEICKEPRAICRASNKVKKILVDNKPDMVTATSQFVIDKLREHGLFINTKSTRLFNAISLDDAGLATKTYDTIDILYSGQLTRIKGIHILINAFKQLKHKHTKLHIAGRGNYVEKLREMAGGDSRIVFHGFKQWDELRALYKKATFTVVPSVWYEPFGNIVIESYKYGTPVIASRIGGIPEIVEDGYNGYLFEAGNVNQLKKIMESLIENPPELRKLSQGAFESVKGFDINNRILEIEELYQQVIG